MSNIERPQAALNMVELHNRLLKLEKDTVDRDDMARVRLAILERRADQNANLRERLERAVQRLTGAGPVARADKVDELEKRIRELEMRITPRWRHDSDLTEDEYLRMLWPTASVTRQEPAEEPAEVSLPEHTHETYARYLDSLIAWGNRGTLLTSGEAAVLDSIRKKLRGTVGR